MNAILENNLVWARAGDGKAKKRQESILIGAKLDRKWLEETVVETTQIRFDGELSNAFADLIAAAKQAKAINLPIVRLRAALMFHIDGMIFMDRDLGVVPRNAHQVPCALELYRIEEDADTKAAVRTTIVRQLKSWCMNVLEPWAVTHHLESASARLKAAVLDKHVLMLPNRRALFNQAEKRGYQYDFPMIIRHLSTRLVNQSLFDGLGPCEIVAVPDSSWNSIELMSAPKREASGEIVFSMVARLSVVTMPYSDDLYLRVAASKRVWAKMVPGRKPNAPRRISGYVISPGRPIMLASVQHGAEGWQFGDDYEQLRIESNRELPESLKEAVTRLIPSETGWWAGMPELTTMFNFVSPRTTFEGDEHQLLEQVTGLLTGIADLSVPFKLCPLPKQRSGTSIPMLKLSNLSDVVNLGVAGESLTEESDDDLNVPEDDDEGADTLLQQNRQRIEDTRKRNMLALKVIHNGVSPVLWTFGGSEKERKIIAKSVEALFGDAVEIRSEVLPKDVHGLKANLPGAESNTSVRFDKRVAEWKRQVSAAMAAVKGPKYALICAPDYVGKKAEDVVNYYAGIHAMCCMGANVHHVLPAKDVDDQKDLQNFVHRLQSALLDVFFAHSGIVFGVPTFMKERFPLYTPKAVYGIQAVRSRARNFSGEMGVSMLIFTRLRSAGDLGVTEVRYACAIGSKTTTTAWMPLSEGLRWLGTQRHITSDEKWLKLSFKAIARDVIGEICADDPRAVIMVDWQNMAGLWQGIRDTDLQVGSPPRLDDISLLVPGSNVSFVRIRKGFETLALRAISRQPFAAYREGDIFVETGEVFTEQYTTTAKCLIEMNSSAKIPDFAGTRNGHFIASMGYRSTVQLQRGLSCYRPMRRMKKMGDGDFYREVVFTPLKKDAALPSSIEVTVMSCPLDTDPTQIAITVIGLQLGYAHYSDWTALPAPLFFKKKIEDYVIRYRESDGDDDGVLEAAPGTEAPTPTSAEANAQTQVEPNTDVVEASGVAQGSGYLDAVTAVVLADVSPTVAEGEHTALEVEAVGSEEAETAISGASVTSTDEDEEEAPEEALPEGDDLLSRAKRAARQMPTLYANKEPKIRRLYEAIMQGRVKVQVELPFFVTRESLFGGREKEIFNPTAVTRFWSRTGPINFRLPGEPAAVASKMPDWIFARLNRPQAAYCLENPWLFPPTAPLFNSVLTAWEKYVESLTVEERDALSEYISFPKLIRWAEEKDDDLTLGWVIVKAAQSPGKRTARTILQHVTKVGGPCTEAALEYFVDSAEAVQQAYEQRNMVGKGFLRIYKPARLRSEVPESVTSPSATAEIPADEDSASNADEFQFQQKPMVVQVRQALQLSFPLETAGLATADVKEAQVAASSSPATSLSALTSDIRGMVDKLSLGSAEFPDQVAAINALLADCLVLHSKTVEAQNRAAEQLVKEGEVRARLEEEANDLIQKIAREIPDIAGAGLTYVAPLEMPTAIIKEELSTIQEQAKRAISDQNTIESIENMVPPGFTPRERARFKSDEMAKAFKALEESIVGLEDLLQRSALFQYASGTLSAPAEIVPDPAPTLQPMSSVQEEQPELPVAGDGDGEIKQQEAPEGQADELSVVRVKVQTVQPSEPSLRDAGAKASAVESSLAKSIGEQIQTIAATANAVLLQPMPELTTDTDTEPQVEQDDELDLVVFGQEYEQHLPPLTELIKHRFYALAKVHASALKASVPDRSFNQEHTLLQALLDTLTTVDGKFEVDPVLPQSFVKLLKSDYPQMGNKEEQLAVSVAVLGASILCLLFEAPHVSTNRWDVLIHLQNAFEDFPGITSLLTHIGSFEGQGIQLTREIVTAARVGAHHAQSQELGRMRERAKGWSKDRELLTSFTHVGFRSTHEALFANDSPIGQCMTSIAKGDIKQVLHCYPEAKKRFDKPSMALDEASKKAGERNTPDGFFRRQMMDNLKVTHAFVDKFIDIAKSDPSGDRTTGKKTIAMLEGLYSDLARAIDELGEMSPFNSIARAYSEAATASLKAVVRVFDEQPNEPCVAERDQLLLLRLPLGRDLQPTQCIAFDDGLEVPVCEPSTVLAETGRLATALPEKIAKSPTGWLHNALVSAAMDHVDASRILPARAIESVIKLPTEAIAALEMQHRKARTILESALREARLKVRHAISLAAIGEMPATALLNLIEELTLENQPSPVYAKIGDPLGKSSRFPDFAHATSALRIRVTQLLEQKLAESKSKLKADLDQYVLENKGSPMAERGTSRVTRLLNEGNASSIRAATETFDLLKKGNLPARETSEKPALARFEEFLAGFSHVTGSAKSRIENLQELLRKDTVPEEPAWIHDLSAEQRLEAEAFIGTWLSLCNARTAQEAQPLLEAFFHGIGLPNEPSFMADHRGSKLLHFVVPEGTFRGLVKQQIFVPPALGSMAKYIQGFLLPHRPQETEFSQVVTEWSDTTITFVMGRRNFSVQQRAMTCRGSMAILIDDNLVAYMAANPDERIARLMEVMLLTLHTNPYDDYGVVPVPREMFFGRQKELQELRNVVGSAVLFGGRRLGKSSLLNQIEEDARRNAGDHVIYIPLDTKIDLASYGEDYLYYAWKSLFRALTKPSGLLPPPKTDPSTAMATRDWIEREINEGHAKFRACYLLIDEADTLMGLDLNSGAHFISELQKLCESVRNKCSIRYVIAGLHNLKRMSTEENSALGKSTAISLEPFSKQEDILEGMRLVTRPLAALGFHFAKNSEDLPLRIMAICNYYPAFIQMYCKTLLNHLFNRRRNELPGNGNITITESDLDAVERDEDFLHDIQKKFELNLDLDKRYKAIGLILADVYYSGAEGNHTKGLTPTEIREFCEMMAGKHFQRTGYGAYEALLDEMKKLTILEKVGPRYQLRTPHIAVMMGDRDRVQHQLDELEREIPKESRVPGETRMEMRLEKQRTMFPFPAAWVRSQFDPADGELLILVGNNLTGLPEIGQAKGEWSLGPEILFEAKAIGTPDSALLFLSKMKVAKTGPRKKFVAATANSWKPENIQQYAEVAGSIATQGTSSLKFALLTNPDTAYALARRIEQGSMPISKGHNGAKWNIVRVPEWNDDALFFHLNAKENVDVRDNQDTREALLEASCGFGRPLEKICGSAITVKQALKAVGDIKNNIGKNLAAFYTAVGMPHDISSKELDEVGKFLLVIEGAMRDSAEVDMMREESGVSEALFMFFEWMGLVQADASRQWRIPTLYKNLLQPKE
jgi:hypothetical protein